MSSPGGAVQQAFLKVFAKSGAPQGFRVYATSPAWTESTITHSNAPALGALVATVAPYTAANTWRTIDVTSAVGGPGGFGFAIVEPGAQADIVLASKEGGPAAELDLVVQTGDPPVNTALPAVTGTLRVDQTLTAIPGAWTGTEPIGYAYQWQRCGPAGGGCVDVPGAVGTTFLLEPVDVDRTVRVREAATNVAGSASATSAATTRVAPASAPPTLVTAPAVTGTPQLGKTLTAVPGVWAGAPPITLSYQWERCGPAPCVDVPGATGTTYAPDPADVGSTLRVRETAANEIGSSSAASAATAPVIDPGDPPVAHALPASRASRGSARI